MADILLIMPQICRGPFEAATISWQNVPLGLLHISATCVQAGYTVKILDARVDPHFQSAFQRELNQDPIFVGFHAHLGTSIKSLCQLSKYVKSLHPEIPVVYGGVIASLNPYHVLAKKYVDYVVVNEGEITACELAEAIRHKKDISHIPRIAYRDNGEVRVNPERTYVDLDTMPLVAWDLIAQYRNSYMELLSINNGIPLYGVSIMTSRGCPKKCPFCYNASSFNRKFRAMSVDRVVSEVQNLIVSMGTRNVNFIDDNFLIDRQRVTKIFQRLDEHGIHINFKCDARINDIDNEDFLKFLVEHGLKSLFLGVESGSRRVLNNARKGIDVEQIYRVAALTKKYGISNTYSFILGYRGEKKSDVSLSIKLADYLKDNDPFAFFDIGLYTPTFGTEEFENLNKQYDFYPKDFEQFKDCNWASVNFKPWLKPAHFYKNLFNALFIYFNPSYRLLSKARFFSPCLSFARFFTRGFKQWLGIRMRTSFWISLWEATFFRFMLTQTLIFFVNNHKNQGQNR